MALNMTTHNLRRILVSQMARQTINNLLGWWAMTLAELMEEPKKAAGALGGAFTDEAWLLERAPLPVRPSSW